MRAALILLLLIAACGRPLTPTEARFAAELHGGQINAGAVRLHKVPVGFVSRTYPTRPQVACRERIQPPPQRATFEATTAGVVLGNQALVDPDWFLDDYLVGYPERIDLIAAMFFAHEMTHVWQWQNRARTGYSPLRAAAEHVPGADPYLFDPEARLGFLDFGYEQQAAIVEEYVCCRTLAPEGARTERLAALLRQAMPLQSALPPDEVILPWAEADLSGICD